MLLGRCWTAEQTGSIWVETLPRHTAFPPNQIQRRCHVDNKLSFDKNSLTDRIGMKKACFRQRHPSDSWLIPALRRLVQLVKLFHMYNSKGVDALLDVGDSLSWVEVLGTRLGAVHDSVTPAIFVIVHTTTSGTRGVVKGAGGRQREK